MVDILSMVDLTSISAMLAATGVLVGVAFAVLELRNLVRARQTEFVIGFLNAFNTKEFTEADLKVLALEPKDYKDFVKKYGPITSGKPIHIAVRMVGSLFETLGVLTNRKIIDIDLIRDLFGVRLRWEKLRPVAEGMRKQLNEPHIFEWFEYLHNELQKREQQLAN